MKRAIFLDRDGTLIEDTGYPHKSEDLKILDVIGGLKRLQKAGFLLFIISNQSGVGRGFYTEKDMEFFHKLFMDRIEGVHIERTYFCMHKPEDNCCCRKPSPHFIFKIAKEYKLDLSRCYVIGDKQTDFQMAVNAGCQYYAAIEFNRAVNAILGSKDKIYPRADIGRIKTLPGEVMVTLNGTFDVLHEGHDYIIKRAKAQGSFLVVGVNSDVSTRRLKGKGRPINTELMRAKALAAYPEVDYVTIFNELTPIKILQHLKPDIHVNGAEYGPNCVEAPTVYKNGGMVCLVKRLHCVSSTAFIKSKNWTRPAKVRQQ